jgi:hypothetical protein
MMKLLTKPEVTPTRIMRDDSTPQSTRPGDEEGRVWSHPESAAELGWTLDLPVAKGPPEDALIKVVMTFEGGIFRMEAVDVGVSVEGGQAPSVYGRLIDSVRARLEASGLRAGLLRYAPDTWFRFVPPDQAITGGHRKSLAERLDDAYRDDALTPEEKGLLDDAANQFGSRLSDEE